MRSRLLPLAAVLVLASTACRSKPTREWRAEDHDEEPTQPSPGAPAAAGAPAGAGGANDDAIADAAWRTACSSCHGMTGRGDGPKAPMTQPPNLTDPAYLGTRTDEQLTATIVGGKGKMPAFAQLPPGVVAGLVRRVRALAGK